MTAAAVAGSAWPRRSDRLVVTRAGARTVCEGWLEPAGARDFDLWISWHEAALEIGPNASTARSSVCEERRGGPNLAGLAALFAERRDELASYALIALLDDDIEIDARGLARLFERAAAGRYLICQPALSHDSFYSHALTLAQPAMSVRHVNFVEMMCPVFRAETLLECLPLFGAGLEVGIDMLWCHLGEPRPGDHAIIDDVVVRHARPIGLRKAENGFAGGRRYEDDVAEASARYGLERTTPLAFDGVDRRGRRRASRLALAFAALGVADAPWRRRPVWPRLRAVLVLWVRTATRPARYRRLSVGGAFGRATEGVRGPCPAGTARPEDEAV